ncbi:hypothetical protein C0Q70_00814 [Pomacea canaliculata]|uniref:FAD-dependent oxidoreductase domain-containing protein 2 n=1 Tax=Pomacea canaliculata TaxID=400727 RepID=A0A2T7PXP9_POMCA|nr:hypothetical protein C0Q70_00814 [Pomacea canaliculata]
MTPRVSSLNALTSHTVALTVITSWAFLLLLLTPPSFALTSEPHRYHDYCIVGAGPAGLQLGFFLKRAGRDYIVFERSTIPGQFFVDYPRHRKLISINKRHTGRTNKEFNLRHDWNSLLSDDESLLFRNVPHADQLLRYLRDYQQRLGIKVQFSTEISNIHSLPDDTMPDGVLYYMNDQLNNSYSCKVLIIATGMGKPNIPAMKGIEYADGYESMSLNPEDYEGKSVLILGHGNSAFEVADRIYGVTNLIHMIARSRIRLSWATHYVGDLRGVNNALLDTYQLKSLDGLLETSVERFELKKRDGKIFFTFSYQDRSEFQKLLDNFPLREQYDKVIRCLGFTFDFSLFQNKSLARRSGRLKKFPAINYNYESSSHPGVFFAGTATHSLDFRKSAGGFIHGFRYTTRTLHRLLEWRYEKVLWPHQPIPMAHLMNQLLKRMNEASGLYQMFQILGDVIVLSKDGESAYWFEEFPINMLPEFTSRTGFSAKRMLVLVMEYGSEFSGEDKDNFRYDRAVSHPSKAHNSNFLHPVLYYYEKVPTELQMKTEGEEETFPRPAAIHHIVEDFLTSWDRPFSHIMPLRHFLDHITKTDLRDRFSQACFFEAMTHDNVGLLCKQRYLMGQGLSATPEMMIKTNLEGLWPK